MRDYTEIINPCHPFYKEKVDNLCEKLKRTFHRGSGLSQPAHPENEDEWRDEIDIQLKMMQEEKDCVLDIIAALGMEIDGKLVVPRERFWMAYRKQAER